MSTKSCPAISVILPIYNMEQYLSDALDSILRQSYPQEKIDTKIANVDKRIDALRQVRDFYSIQKIVQDLAFQLINYSLKPNLPDHDHSSTKKCLDIVLKQYDSFDLLKIEVLAHSCAFRSSPGN